jgi:hypothetical protein
MIRKYDPITHRYPRTLEEAFGPYERGNIQEDDDGFPPMPLLDALLVYAGALLFAYLTITALVGLFK